MKQNNYRVYHEPGSDKLYFLPQGMDMMFWDPNGPIQPDAQGLVARAVLQAPEGNRRYRARLTELFARIYRVEVLTNRVNQLQAQIQPALNSFSPEAAAQHRGHVDQLRHLIIQRAAGIERQMHRLNFREQ